MKKTILLVILTAGIVACHHKPEGSSDSIKLSYENCIAMENDSDHLYHQDEIARVGCPIVIFDAETNAAK